MREWASLDEVVLGVWSTFGQASGLPSRVSPSMPILFFGDLHAYFSSRVRVLSVGLNPSLHEFPTDSPFRRFPLAEGVTLREPEPYLDALSASRTRHFRTDPYRGWFSAFEPMLNGLGASFYEGKPSTALHTDLCSPVATDPTWSGLDPDEQKALEKEGGPLWHGLLEVLQPPNCDAVCCVPPSIAHPVQSLEWMEEFGCVVPIGHVFERTEAGALRKRPVEISARWCEIGGEPSLFVFVPCGTEAARSAEQQPEARCR